MPALTRAFAGAEQGSLYGHFTFAGYGTSLGNTYRQIARYVARIRKGAKPLDLPAQRPSKFEVVLNLRAAKALGLTIPPMILLRANEVIE